MKTLVLVDGDPLLATLLGALLRPHGYALTGAKRGVPDPALLSSGSALLLIDVSGRDGGGFELCRRLRAAGDRTPIIFLIRPGNDADGIQGLKLGADDYMAKPLNHLELLARIEAVLRRKPAALLARPGLDPMRRSLHLDGRDIALTAMEYRLLEALANHPGRVYSRAELVDWLEPVGGAEGFDRAIDSHVSRLRKKIEGNPREPKHLQSVRGLGYCFRW